MKNEHTEELNKFLGRLEFGGKPIISDRDKKVFQLTAELAFMGGHGIEFMKVINAANLVIDNSEVNLHGYTGGQ